MPETRKHAAIMFTDIVGYTRLMGSDEEKAVDMLSRNRSIHQSCINKFNGTLIKEIGDGILASFSLASEAVRCAIEIQKECKEQGIPLKIGIHEGEMIFSGSDVIGDGVNIASRLQEDAQEGCINISGAVYSNIRNKADIQTKIIGEKSYKNVGETIKVYKIEPDEESGIKDKGVKEQKKSKKNMTYYFLSGLVIIIVAILVIWKSNSSNEKAEYEKSIAVLPFENMSGDEDQEAMCDGITEEIIHHLSQIESLDKVISRTSVMKFKNSDKTIKEIAEILDVNIILEGSYRESGDQIRITTQLIDAQLDDHIWSEIYEKQFGDIFKIQSDIAKNVATQLKIELTNNEEAILDNNPDLSDEAYKLVNKAKYIAYKHRDYQGAIEMLKQALELSPNSATIYAVIGSTHLAEGSWYGKVNMHEAIVNALPYARKALELDSNNGKAIGLMGQIIWWNLDFVGFEEHYKKYGKEVGAGFLLPMGRFEEAIPKLEEIMENHPKDDNVYISFAYYLADQKEKSLEALNRAVLRAGEGRYDWLGMICVFHEKYHEAIFYFQGYAKLWKEMGLKPRPMDAAWLGISYHKMGDLNKSDSLKNELINMTNNYESGTPKFFLGLYYSGIGDIDNAFKWLEESYKVRDVELYWFKAQPVFDILRDDPRYKELYRKIGFEAYDEYFEEKKNGGFN